MLHGCQRALTVADVVVTVVVTSAVILKNLDGLQYVGNHVVGLVVVSGPGSSVDPDRPEARGPSAGYVRGHVVTDHPSALGERRAATLGRNLEQTDIGLTRMPSSPDRA
ncbi:hypothetical protein Mame01_53730 [Microbispora amethystogenes]|nr:hypothetical protein Mame01_53730 [Microbispora amethystogenes]